MQINHYPGYAAQRSQHIDLTRQVLELRSQFATGQTVITIDVMKFLKDWLVDHIQGSDKPLGAYLAARA
jgi:hemerythrin